MKKVEIDATDEWFRLAKIWNNFKDKKKILDPKIMNRIADENRMNKIRKEL